MGNTCSHPGNQTVDSTQTKVTAKEMNQVTPTADISPENKVVIAVEEKAAETPKTEIAQSAVGIAKEKKEEPKVEEKKKASTEETKEDKHNEEEKKEEPLAKKGSLSLLFSKSKSKSSLKKSKDNLTSDFKSADTNAEEVATAVPTAAPKSPVPGVNIDISPPEPIHNGGKWDNVVFVLGGPGSGKGTNCERLAKEFKYTHISAGDVLRAEVKNGANGQMLEQLMKEGKIVPMEITIKLLRNAMEAATECEGFLIDGFPRAHDQAKEFSQTVCLPKFILFFDCCEETMRERLLSRGKSSGRADDNEETIVKRFKTFMEESLPVVEAYERDGKVRRVDGTKPVDEVYAQAKSYFESK